MPEAVGVPLMVMRLAFHAAVTPFGKPEALPMPVAPVVVWLIAVRTVLIHKVGVVVGAVTVLFGFTVIIPVALTVPQPPFNGMV